MYRGSSRGRVLGRYFPGLISELVVDPELVLDVGLGLEGYARRENFLVFLAESYECWTIPRELISQEGKHVSTADAYAMKLFIGIHINKVAAW